MQSCARGRAISLDHQNFPTSLLHETLQRADVLPLHLYVLELHRCLDDGASRLLLEAHDLDVIFLAGKGLYRQYLVEGVQGLGE